MQKTILQDGYWEPVVTQTFLPRCVKCHNPHPLARTPKIVSDTCPDCGTNVVTGITKTIPALITGKDITVAIGLLFLKIGKWLNIKGKGY